MKLSRQALVGLVVPVTAIILAGCAGGAATVTPSSPAAPSNAVLGAPAADVAPAPGGDTSTVSSGETGAGSSSSAIAYPYPVFGGSPGLAPDHELVVSGVGTAAMKADQSDRAAAQRTALAAAMADAKAQATTAASEAGVTLGGVLSVSVSVAGGYYGIEPMSSSGGSPDSAPASGAVSVPPVAPATPTSAQLQVTVTVAYSIS
ncbi:MAG TPA: SIMPL domain-containing protein [Candidatus Sulfotelmatobacter sp.]|nr:SIMPL domain-containing protein [Candidatus Sulfotelmatobacter sp.]